MICWICKKPIRGKLIALTKHFEKHRKYDIITKMVWLYYSQPRKELLKLDREERKALSVKSKTVQAPIRTS